MHSTSTETLKESFPVRSTSMDKVLGYGSPANRLVSTEPDFCLTVSRTTAMVWVGVLKVLIARGLSSK